MVALRVEQEQRLTITSIPIRLGLVVEVPLAADPLPRVRQTLGPSGFWSPRPVASRPEMFQINSVWYMYLKLCCGYFQRLLLPCNRWRVASRVTTLEQPSFF